MGSFRLRGLVALVLATLVCATLGFAVAPRTLAVETATVDAVAVEAAATYPTSATCTSAAKNRARTEGPECTVTVECPSDSAGCAFSASGTFESKRTVGTAQGRLRITEPSTGAMTDFFCSSPAAVSAKDAGCTVTTPTIFLPAGTVLSATCTWVGSTVSVNPRVTCSATFTPLGGG
jgi:hypothetical protein